MVVTEVNGQLQTPSTIAIPRSSLQGKRVLDVGCGTGKDLQHPAYAETAERCGIDIHAESIAYGLQHYPGLNLSVARAEHLPFEDERFDLVISRVALPYTNIPVALREIYRVLKPNGELLLTMHTCRMQAQWLVQAIRTRAWKRVIDHLYILGASVIYLTYNRVPARPWSSTRETFQVAWRLRRGLRDVGFDEIRVNRDSEELLIRAIK